MYSLAMCGIFGTSTGRPWSGRFPALPSSRSPNQIARHAATLLSDASLHRHKYAVDAMLSATALAAPGPITILTSDPDDLAALCGVRVTVVKV
ncbi:hypothetical protein [Nonomuraea sp. B1E8]|uniref:hypothetical protein n=1 Tax=unclassified Nonomuraea TaxID=2593643 RepID=UPI00325D407B